MIFTTKYGRTPRIEISTTEELDAYLNQVANTGDLYGVKIALGTIAQWDPQNKDGVRDELPILDLGIGHPERSYLIFYGELFGWGIDDSLPELDETLTFNCVGEAEERGRRATRVTVDQARKAARQFVATGERPTNIEWFEPANEDYYS